MKSPSPSENPRIFDSAIQSLGKRYTPKRPFPYPEKSVATSNGSIRQDTLDQEQLKLRISSMARAVTNVALEVLTGRRPSTQLSPVAAPEVVEKFALRAQLIREVQSKDPRSSRMEPLRIGRTIIQMSSPETFEAVVLCHGRERTRACALKIIRRRTSWHVAEMELG